MGIDELISRYKDLDGKIKDMSNEKRLLESEIIGLLNYNREGQKTIETINHKVCVKAGYYYRVTGDVEYIIQKDLPPEVNPFKHKISWELDKKRYEMLSAYPQYKEIVDDFIEKMPKPVKLEVL